MNFDSTKFISSIANSLSNSQEECIDLMSRTLNTVVDDNIMLRGSVNTQNEKIEKLREENEMLKKANRKLAEEKVMLQDALDHEQNALAAALAELDDVKAALKKYQTNCDECDGCDAICDACDTLERLRKAEDKLARIGVLFKRFSDEVKD